MSVSKADCSALPDRAGGRLPGRFRPWLAPASSPGAASAVARPEADDGRAAWHRHLYRDASAGVSILNSPYATSPIPLRRKGRLSVSQCIAAQVATAAGLDMRMCWTATKDSYLSRVPKALIVDAVRQGAGMRAAGKIAGSKKEVMVADADQLLAGTGWFLAHQRRNRRAARGARSGWTTARSKLCGTGC
jgi:hypothetical protein